MTSKPPQAGSGGAVDPPGPALIAEYVVVFGPSEHCPKCLGRGYWFGAVMTVRIHCRRCNGLGYVQSEDDRG